MKPTAVHCTVEWQGGSEWPIQPVSNKKIYKQRDRETSEL